MSTHFSSSFRSCDKVHDIAYYAVFPQTAVRGVVQIAHGMAEHFERYSGFADFLAEKGFVVCGEDHLGHGRSVSDDTDYGYFAQREGWQCVVKDMYKLTRMMKKSYPEVPYFIFGHSMGSFLARAFVTCYHRALDGAVFCGTSGGQGGTEAMLTMLDIAKRIHGEKYKGEFFNKLAFGSYNNGISPRNSDFDWLSRDTANVARYCNDKRCGFTFTINGFENLIKMIWYVSNDKWYSSYPKDLPTYLISGSADPVGNYGKGVLKVFNNLNLYNCNVEMKIYKDARHELLNEINKDEVYSDVLDFFETVME
ncbi:alpha/beta hydrolase [Ruminococcus sp. FC2018]|uniref:alpha/beta fold hydrolase n=1 Tax=Ruminococcus sp. FC2018 TaxID=1410617 RepID=UPI00048CE123|nr:alpha/beta hydrolase [Ruminococcus sp. FC2018]